MLFAIIAMVFSFQALAQNANCDIPNADNSICIEPTSFDYETIQDGNWYSATTWLNGNVPSTENNSNKSIKITHHVSLSNDNIKLQGGTVLYMRGETSSLILENGNLYLEGGASKAILKSTILRTYGDIEQKENTNICMTDVELSVGEEAAGIDFISGQSSTQANFKNDGGFRWLQSVCGNVTGNFENLGEDYIVNSTFDIGDTGSVDRDIDGQDSGNLANEKGAMTIRNSEFYIPNGNFQNSSYLDACDARFRLIKGNIHNKEQIQGENIVLWSSSGNIQNEGSWDGTSISAWNSNGNPEGIENLPSATAIDVIDSLFLGCIPYITPIACEETFAGTGTITNAFILIGESGVETLSVIPNGDAVLSEGTTLGLLVTQGPDLIIRAFSNTTDVEINSSSGFGEFRAHLFAYDESTLDLSTVVVLGQTVAADILNTIAANDLCASLEPTGLPFIALPQANEKNGASHIVKTVATKEIKLYPNPAFNDLNVELPLLDKEKMNYNMMDLNGRQVLSGSFDNASLGRTKINTNELTNGFYIITFNSEFRSFSKKVLVKH